MDHDKAGEIAVHVTPKERSHCRAGFVHVRRRHGERKALSTDRHFDGAPRNTTFGPKYGIVSRREKPDCVGADVVARAFELTSRVPEADREEVRVPT
jgi:hypothetical protein